MINLDELTTLLAERGTLVDKTVSWPGIQWILDLERFQFQNFLWTPSSVPDRIFSFMARDSFDAILCSSMIEAIESRLHSIDIHDRDHITVLHPLHLLNKSFDSLFVLPDGFHRRLTKLSAKLEGRAFEVYPAWRCELLGSESPIEFERISKGKIIFTDWNRSRRPCCYLCLFKSKKNFDSGKLEWNYSDLEFVRDNAAILLGEPGSYAMAIKNFAGEEHVIRKDGDTFKVAQLHNQSWLGISPAEFAIWLERLCT